MKTMHFILALLTLAMLLSANPGPDGVQDLADQGARPNLEYFHTPNLRMIDTETQKPTHDAPVITNNRIWAQAAALKGQNGLLNMEDVWAGRERIWHRNTLLVNVNHENLAPEPADADWWPNRVRRRATVGSIDFEGNVKVARHKMALLSELKVVNTGSEPQKLRLAFEFGQGSGLFGMVEKPDALIQMADGRTFYLFENDTVAPGQTVYYHAINLYRDSEKTRDLMLEEFDHHWQRSDEYSG